MTPNGVAIFYRDSIFGDQPVHFEWGTDSTSIDRAWNAAMQSLSAKQRDELRREGYFASLVSLMPLTEEEIGPRGFVEECLRLVAVEVVKGECTSHAGNDWSSETILEAKLASDVIRVPMAPHQPALPEFSADYLESHDEGDVELPLYFVLQGRTSTHAIYSVQLWESQPPATRGKMAPSRRRLFSERQQIRKHG